MVCNVIICRYFGQLKSITIFILSGGGVCGLLVMSMRGTQAFYLQSIDVSRYNFVDLWIQFISSAMAMAMAEYVFHIMWSDEHAILVFLIWCALKLNLNAMLCMNSCVSKAKLRQRDWNNKISIYPSHCNYSCMAFVCYRSVTNMLQKDLLVWLLLLLLWYILVMDTTHSDLPGHSNKTITHLQSAPFSDINVNANFAK